MYKLFVLILHASCQNEEHNFIFQNVDKIQKLGKYTILGKNKINTSYWKKKCCNRTRVIWLHVTVKTYYVWERYIILSYLEKYIQYTL